jgi:hypothetical protein
MNERKNRDDSNLPKKAESNLIEGRGVIGDDIVALAPKAAARSDDDMQVVLTDAKDSGTAVLLDAAASANKVVVEAARSTKQALVEAKDTTAETLRDYKDTTVAAISDAVDDVSSGVQRAGRATWRFARENSVPLALMSLGAGWMIYSQRVRNASARPGVGKRPKRATSVRYPDPPRGRIASYGAHPANLATTSDEFRDGSTTRGNFEEHTAAAGLSKAIRKAEHQAERVASEASQSAQELGRRVGSVVRQRANQGRTWVKQSVSQIGAVSQKLAAEQPLAVGAAALAVGLGAGLWLPSTAQENEWLGEQRDHLLNEARDAVDGVREAAESMGETAKETVRALV